MFVNRNVDNWWVFLTNFLLQFSQENTRANVSYTQTDDVFNSADWRLLMRDLKFALFQN